MAQQQTFTLPLGYFGERPPHRLALFAAQDDGRRAGELIVDRVLVETLQPTDAFQSCSSAPRRPQSIEGYVESDAAKPGADFAIWAGLQRGLVGQLEKGFL